MSALYFGTGVSSPTLGVSDGLAFEYFGFLCDAFRIANERGCDRVVQEITDSYQERNCVSPETDALQVQAYWQQALIKELAQSLGVADQFTLVLASEFRETTEYQQCLANIREQAQQKGIVPTSDYVLLQSAGVDYFRQNYNVAVKMGWVIDPDDFSQGKLDEYYFNMQYQRITGDGEFPFEYVGPGIFPNGRGSPYQMRRFTDREIGRVAIDWPFENREKFVSLAQGKKGEKKYYTAVAGIVQKFEDLCEAGIFKCNFPWDPETTSLPRKIDLIITDLFRVESVKQALRCALVSSPTVSLARAVSAAPLSAQNQGAYSL